MKCFNTEGICIPEINYMADTSKTIHQIIDQYVSPGKYFTIDRPRQYGKTTTLYLLEKRLKKDYIVLSISFESADELFTSLSTFAAGFIRKTARILKIQDIPEYICSNWQRPLSKDFPFDDLGQRITELCTDCPQSVILMIDEVDKSSDNQIFLSFLGLLREKYLKRQQGKDSTFQSVILAGVYDVKTLKIKLHPEEEAKYNSPWNIAVNFVIDMSFSAEDIDTMLEDYEKDYHTGMDRAFMSRYLYEYTSGYPFLVSKLCQLLDERVSGTEPFLTRARAWTKEGFLAAVKLLLMERNTLFDDMVKKLLDHPKLEELMQGILFGGSSIPFKRESPVIDLGVTLGFLKDRDGMVAVANRIFETQMYDLFLADMAVDHELYIEAASERNQFIVNGMLQMDLVMKKFYEYYEEIYSDNDQKFIEENGRKLFLLYLKPIINGNGNYYVEARTRDHKRTDIIVDYKGKQFVIELKLWRGDAYNMRGEKQIFEYLDFYKQDKGYMLSFNFNRNKKTGIQELNYRGKRILEVVV